MKLRIAINEGIANVFFVCGKKEPPEVGEVFDIVDKKNNSKPLCVRLREIVTHQYGGDIYCVDLIENCENDII